MAMSVKTSLSALDCDLAPSHRARVRSVRQKLLVWRAVSIGISTVALIVIISQLYTVCKEVKFLQNIQSEWLPKLNASAGASASALTAAASNSQQQLQQVKLMQTRNIENLRKDFDLLIIELWSTRTTLILGVVFVLAYIFSWVWMTYQLELTLCVSLKSVLLLVVFAAVDIAASTGFILVRVIMSLLNSSEFPHDMRIPFANGEQDQFASIASLRLAVLQSTAGGSEIFISGLVAVLTAIRVYLVVNAVKFYNCVRKQSDLSPASSGSTGLSSHHHHHVHSSGFHHTNGGNNGSTASPQPSAHSALHHHSSSHHGLRSSSIVHNNSGGDVSDSSGYANDANVLLVGVSKVASNRNSIINNSSSAIITGASTSGSDLHLTGSRLSPSSLHHHHQQLHHMHHTARNGHNSSSTPSPRLNHRTQLHISTVDRRSPYTPSSNILINAASTQQLSTSPLGMPSSTSNILGLSSKEIIYGRTGPSLTRKYSIATESLTGDDDMVDIDSRVDSDDFKIQAADMPLHMQRTALSGAVNSCKLYKTEKSIAESIKSDFDTMYGPTWHCIVGRNWGSCVTHSKQCYIRILYKDLTILLYKST